MKGSKKFISGILVFILFFTGLPVQFSANMEGVRVYAEESELSDEEITIMDKSWLTLDRIFGGSDYFYDPDDHYNESFGDYDYSIFSVTDDVYMPFEAPYGSTISWYSSDEEVIDLNGRVTRPGYLQGASEVKLVASFLKGAAQVDSIYKVEVSPLDPTPNEQSVLDDRDWIYDAVFYGIFIDDIRMDSLDLPAIGPKGSAITWVSSNPAIIDTDGNVTHPAFSYAWGRAPVTLTATITGSGAEVQQTYDLEVYPQPPTDEERVAYYKFSLTDEVILNGNRANNVMTSLQLPTESGSRYFGDMPIGDCTIDWQSSNPDVITNSGEVTRPPMGQASVMVTLTATISYGGASDTKTFNFTVTPIEEFPLAISYDDFSNIDRLQFNGISGVANTTDREGNPAHALLFESGDGASGGSVFTKNKVRLGDDLSFSTAFSFRNLNPDSYDNGNSGFTFTLQTVGSAVYGQSLDDQSIKPSISIAFVTSRSIQGSGQAEYTFIDVSARAFYNGDFDNGMDAWYIGGTRADLPPEYYHAWIEYDGTAQVLEVWCVPSEERPDSNYSHLRAENVDLEEILTGAGDGLSIEDVRDVYAGFMGSTGDARDKSEIYNWYFKNDSTPIDQNPYDFYDASNVTLLASAEEMLRSTLTASVSGADGPVAGISVEFSTDFGSVDHATVITDNSGNATVTLSAEHTGVACVKAIVSGGATAEIEVPIAATDEDCVVFDRDWQKNGAGYNLLLNGNSGTDNVTTALFLPTAGPNGSIIRWSSNNIHINTADGTVTLPSPEEGEQQVTLTAAFAKGDATGEEIFGLTIRVPDASTVSADDVWLSDERVLNGNSAFASVTGNLFMPVTGQYGSDIRWTSNKEDTVALNGTVTRPTYTDGDQTVILTADLCKGSVETTKAYTVTVKALNPTELEAVTFDTAWLAVETILNGNTDSNNITGNLNLPLSGPRDTSISWESSNISFITENGAVIQPAFSQGEKKVILTATVTKGGQTAQKTFEMTVITLPQTDAEAVMADMEWLDLSRTLGQNVSAFSIKENLFLPSLAPNGSLITWVSDMPGVISDSGTVVRPGYTEGHKTVVLTAVLNKGSVQESRTFTYTVLSLPDLTPPELTGMMVVSNHTIRGEYEVPFNTPVLPWDVDMISISFDEELNYRIGSGQPFIDGPQAPAFSTTRWENDTLFYLKNHLKPGARYELVIPAGYIADKYGNQTTEDVIIPITVEEKPMRTIEVVSSTPRDREKDAPLELSQISFTYNYSDIVKGESFNRITLRRKDGIPVPLPLHKSNLDGDTVVLELDTSLTAGDVYELILPAGAVRDRFMNESSAKTIQFRARTSGAVPVVAGIYPSDGQTGVGIHQNIEITFSDANHPFNNRLQLVDDQGQWMFLYTNVLKDQKNGWLLTPYKPLKPNTVYTLSGPYELPPELDFSISFTTGANGLGIHTCSPAYADKDVPVNGTIEIEFTGSITQGPAFAGIEILDSQGSPVDFHGEERGNKGILTPASNLNAAEMYTVHIPAGAYKGAGGVINDSYRFYFTTASPLELGPDLLDSPSSYLAGKPVQLNTDRLKNAITAAEHEVVSYEWDFGDESHATGENPTHTYSQPGNYIVQLKVKDNKGFFYEFEQTLNIIPLKDIKMSVSRAGSNWIYYADGYALPTRLYTIRLACERIFVPGETISVQLYKNGILQKAYGNITADSMDSAYDFTFTPEWGYSGNYELVFTCTLPTGVMSVREPVTVQHSGDTSFLRVQVYNLFTGETYSDAEYLNVLVDGKEKVAVREWIESLNAYVYTVKEQFPILRHYKYMIKGLSESYTYGSLHNVGNLGDFYERPPIKTVYPKYAYITKQITSGNYKRFYIEGVDVGNVFLTVEGEWKDQEPGYYELQTDKSNIHMTSKTGEFTLRPGRDFKVGDSFMIRMVTKNGVKGSWQYNSWDVLPKPTVLGRKVNVRLVDGIYELSWDTPFGGLVGGSIPLLDSIPFLDGGNFGLGSDMPQFAGVMYKGTREYQVVMDFSGEAGYGQENKKTSSVQNKKSLKKVKAVGYDVDVGIEGDLWLVYDNTSKKWKTEYVVIDMFGRGSKYWSSGYKIAGIIGVEGKLELGVFVGGTLIINKRSSSEYSGIIRIMPEVTASVSGSYGLGDVTGSLTGYIPAEIHIPTGYMEAEVGVKAKVTASFLTYTETLYSKELFKAHWDNGKEKVKALGLMALPAAKNFETEYSGLDPMARDYLKRESTWLAENEVAQRMLNNEAVVASLRAIPMRLEVDMEGVSNPNSYVLMENIYPKAEVQLVQNGDEQWLVWTDDNPQRDAVNRTQLRYSVLKDGTWREPVWMDEDGTADFSPAVVAADNGILMAWQNISQEVSEEEGLRGMIENAEISVTGSVYSTGGSSVQIRTLTHDDKLDHSPRLAADGNEALLVWTKSEGLSFTMGEETEELKAPENSDSLYFSTWDGNLWSDPVKIQGSMPTVLDSNLTMHGDESLLLYTLDMDNDISTLEDREVFARLYDGNTWGEEIRISDNQMSDITPKAVYLEGKWFITWVQDGNIVYKEGIQGEVKTEEFLQDVQNDYQLITKDGANPQAAIVYRKPGQNFAQGLSTHFYDINKSVWSDEISLAEAVGAISSFNPLFSQDGRLNVAYSQAEIITEAVPEMIDGVEKLVEQINVSDKVDLKILTYRPIHDLGFAEEDGLLLSTEIPLPGTMAKVFATIQNDGDFAENTIVDLYDKDPATGGKFITSAVSEEPIAARSSAEVEMEWLVPLEEKDEFELYAVVRIPEGISEWDESNNAIHLNITTADIAVTGVEHENLAKDDYLVNAVIINRGSRALEDIEVKLEHTQSGTVLESMTFKRIEPGQEFPVSFLISARDLKRNENGTINMILRAMLPDDVREYSTDNNTKEFDLMPVSIAVDKSSPGHNDAQVPLDTAVTVSFNRMVEQGAGFEQITLEDENLNFIDVTRLLEGDTLTVTPVSRLENNTLYTLTIPADALGDAYGHTLEERYSISFTTITTSPEVVFAYPGDRMGETPLDTDIRMRFNQNVAEGPAFEGVTMVGANGVKIPVSVSIDGEWLDIQPAESLGGDTTYFLSIPRGTVINRGGEAQQEAYAFEFTTASTDEDDEGNNDDEGDGDEGDEDEGNDDKNNDQVSNDNTGKDVVASDKTGSYKVDINVNGSMPNVELPVTINSDSGSAVVNIRELAEDIFTGDGNTLISMPPIPGVNSYTVEMPATLLSGSYGKASLTFDTSVGSILITSGMLSNMTDLEGKTAGVTISVGDKTTLPDDIRAALGNHPLIQLTLTLEGEQTDWDNPDVPVTVAIPYTPTPEELEHPESIVIWYIDGSGNILSVPNGRYDLHNGTVSFTTTHFSYYAARYNKVTFKDVTATAWYNQAVSFIAARNITMGTGNGNFSPAAMLTRGQFITLLMRAYQIDPVASSTDNFADAGNTYYTGYIAAAKRRGISNGVGNNLFAPDKEITRQEMFTLLYNVLKVIAWLPEGDSGKTLSDFTDTEQIDSWAEDAITLLVETGTISGNAGKLTPKNKATRAEMAQILYRLFQKK